MDSRIITQKCFETKWVKTFKVAGARRFGFKIFLSDL